MVGGQRVLEVGQQLGELLRKIVGCGLPAVALQGEHRQRVGPRRAAEPEIDPSGIERRENRERLCHLQRAVVRKHHTAAAHPDAGGVGGDRPDQRLRAGARQHRPAVVLGDPVAVIAELVRQESEVERVTDRDGAR